MSEREYRLSDDGHVLALREPSCASCAALRALLAEREKEIEKAGDLALYLGKRMEHAEARVAALEKIIEDAPCSTSCHMDNHSAACEWGDRKYNCRCDCWKAALRDGAGK